MQDGGTGIYTSCCALGEGTRGALRMGAHTMERFLLLGCLVALVIPANSVKCHMCVGNEENCNPTEVTCSGDSDMCSSTILNIDSFPCNVRKVFKGCVNSTATSKKLSLSPSSLVTLSMRQEMCNSDLCNKQKISEPKPSPNTLYCHSCISPGSSCNSAKMAPLTCIGEQNKCVDMSVIGSFGDIADVNVKGCGYIPSCTEDMAFSSQTSSVAVQCCDGNFCNGNTDPVTVKKSPNGVQCYSCNSIDGAGCSPDQVVKAQCYGDLTSCLEVAGISLKDGRAIPTVMKGCATPSMCDSSFLPMLQKLGSATVKCCNGSLCNDQLSESSLKASGYLPIGNASPGTGIKNKPSHAISGGNSRRRRQSGSSVKTGHHPNNKYGTGSLTATSSGYSNDDCVSVFNGLKMSPGNGNDQGIKGSWNSNSNSGYPNPSYNEFSNSGSPYITEVDQGSLYDDLTARNPNSVNVLSDDNQTTDRDGNFVENQSNTVPNSISNLSGGNNVLVPGGLGLGGERLSNSTAYNHSDSSSIPDAPPTVPDFTKNVDDSTDQDSMTNDDSNFENGGFAEIVYTDTMINNVDVNNNQSTAPTVTPENIVIPNNNISTQDIPQIVPNYINYVENSTHPNSYYDNNMNYPNDDDFNPYESAGFTEVVFTDIDSNDDQPNSPTVVPDNIIPNGYDSVSNSKNQTSTNNTNIISSDNNNETSGYSVDKEDIGSYNVQNTQENNGSTQNVTPTTTKTYNSDTDQQISGYDSNSYNPNIANNNGSGNYISGANPMGSGNNSSVGNASVLTLRESHNVSNPTNYSAGDNNFSVLLQGGSGLGGENSTDYSSTDDSSVPDEPPAVPDFTSDVDNSTDPNSPYGNNNYSNNVEIESYESFGFNEIIYVEEDQNDDQSSSPTATPDNIISNSYDSVGNSGIDHTLNTYNQNINTSSNNNDTSGHSADTGTIVHGHNSNIQGFTKTKPHNSGIKQDNSGNGTDIYNTGFDNNNGSGNYISSSGNNIAASGNHSSATGSSSNGGYTNIPGGNGSSTTYTSSGSGTGMTNGSSNNNNSVNHNMAVPSGYANIPGSNQSSTSSNSSGYGTGMGNQWINGSSHNIPGKNYSSTSNTSSGTGINNEYSQGNSSNPNMIVPGGSAHIPGNNTSVTSYTSPGNGTGMTNERSNSSSSNPNMSVPGGYASVPGTNGSSTSYSSSGNGTGMTHGLSNSSSSNHSMSVPGGYANIPGRNGSSTSYANAGYETGVSNNNSSNHNMALPGGGYGTVNNNGSNNSSDRQYNSNPMVPHDGSTYGNSSGIDGSWDSIESYLNHMSSGANSNGSWSNSSSFNPSMSVPGGYANIPGSNGSSTSHANAGYETGVSSNNSSNHNMALPGGGYGTVNNNGSNYSSNSQNNSNPMVPHNGSTYGNSSSTGGSWDSTGSSHTSSGAHSNGSSSNSSSSNHSMSVPGGYANIPGSNGSSTSHANSGYETGVSSNNSSNHNMASPGGGYGTVNRNGSNASSDNQYNSNPMVPHNGSTYGNSSSPGGSWDSNGSNPTHMSSGANNNGSWSNSSSSSSSMSVPGGYANIPGSNGSSTSHANAGYETGVSSNNSSNHNMALPGGGYGTVNSNGSNDSSDSQYNSNPMVPHDGSTYGNSSGIDGSWDSIESYLNHISSGANNNGSWSGGSGYSGFNPLLMPNINGSSNGSININEWIQNNMMPPGMNHNGSGPYNINSMYNGSLIDYFKSLGNSWNNSNISNISALWNGGIPGSFNISNFANNNGYFGVPGSNIHPSNSNGMSHGGSYDGHNSYEAPPGGSGVPSYDGPGINDNGHGLNGSTSGNGSSTGSMWSGNANSDLLVPDRSTNDTTGGGGAGNSTGGGGGGGGGGGSMFSGAPSFWTKSWSLVISSTIALLVLN